MCGILYSQDATGFHDLEIIKRRGPEGFSEQNNELGYFAHSMLNTIGETTTQPFRTKNGILLYNGSTYNSGLQNDTLWLGDRLDGNLDNTLSVIRELNGEYALVYATEKHVVFCVDHFDNRNLWFYHNKDNHHLTVASMPTVVRQKHPGTWRAEGNKIYILDRQDFSIVVVNNKTFDLEQKINHFDYVFEEFERAVKSRYHPQKSTVLISSGIDSGVIACATYKLFDDIDCVCDHFNETLSTIKDRMNKHKIVILPNISTQNEKNSMHLNIIDNKRIWGDPCVSPLINIVKNYAKKKSKKIIITGDGGDEIYNDWQYTSYSNGNFNRTNGLFPSSLSLVWPWYNTNSSMMVTNTRVDFISGYFGIEARKPLLDVDLVQAWLNTTLKQKVPYKFWMRLYMDQQKYPYHLDKIPWGKGKYRQ